MDEQLKALHAAMAAAEKAAKAIKNTADGEKRRLSAEEQAQIDQHFAAYDAAKQQADAIESEQRIGKRLADMDAHLSAAPPRRTEPDPIGGARKEGPATLKLGKHTLEFQRGSRAAALLDPAYERAYGQWLRGGIGATLQVSDQTTGGYTVMPLRMAAGIIEALDDEVYMRQLATVLPPLTDAAGLGMLSRDADVADSDWTAEVPAAAISESDTLRFGGRELHPHLLTKLVAASEKLLRLSSINIEAYINARLAYKFAITENKAFLTGSGQKQPLGIFTASDNGLSTTYDVESSVSADFNDSDIVGLPFELKAAYWRNATWLISREFLKRVRLLKDGNGQFVWRAGIAEGTGPTIMDRPYVVDENVPDTFSGGSYVAVLGDFKTGYVIVDALTMEMRRFDDSAYARLNKVGFMAKKETDGMPVLGECFRRLKLKA